MAEAGNQVSHNASHKHGKKRPKSFYVRAKEGTRIRRDFMLSVGMRGILLTCNHGVKPCIKEAYNLLNEYGDQMYGEEKEEEEGDKEGDKEEGSGSEEEEDEDEGEDIEASLQKEIAGMKKKRKARQQRFQAVESGAKNVAFIKSKVNSCELVHRILSDIQETKTTKSRHIMRMLPVTASCRSYLEDIEKQAPLVLKPHFEVKEDGKVFTFCIMFKVRNCGHLKRDEVISTLHRLVTDMGNHTVNLNHAEKVIMVEVVRNVCCLSVLTDFYKLRKYNLQSIMEEFAQDDDQRYRGRKRKFQKKSNNSETGDVGDAETLANENVDGDDVKKTENPSEIKDGSTDEEDVKRQKVESPADVDTKPKTMDTEANEMDSLKTKSTETDNVDDSEKAAVDKAE